MAMAQWYELRVDGSAGTRSGMARGATEGIAIGESGRLCSIASGHSKRFGCEREAMDYLFKTTIPGQYRFEAVLCGHAAPNGDAAALGSVRTS